MQATLEESLCDRNKTYASQVCDLVVLKEERDMNVPKPVHFSTLSPDIRSTLRDVDLHSHMFYTIYISRYTFPFFSCIMHLGLTCFKHI